MHYYQFHIGDFRSATLHLSNAEELAYRRLIDWYYDTETPIPLDTQWVSRRLRVGIEDLQSVLKDFFQETENGWIHSRCDAEIAGYHGMAEKNRVNGKKGGRPRKNKNPVGSQSDASGNPSESQKNPNHEPLTINQEPETKNQKPKQDQDQKPSAAAQPDWIKQLVELGADPKHCKDWMAVRKQKRAPAPTDTVIAAMQREARKANITVAAAVQICAERGWQGFKADWLANKPGGFGGGYSKADDVAAHNQAVVEEIARRQAQRTGSMGNPADPGIDEDGFLTIEGDFFHAT